MAVPLIWVAVTGPATSAYAGAAAHYVGDAPGSVSCTLSATVTFSPRLTESGGGTSASTAKGKLTRCTTNNAAVRITGGTLTGSLAPGNPPTCTSLASLTTAATFAVQWRGLVTGALGATTYGGRATLTPSTVTSAGQRMSSFGGGDLELVLPATSHGASVTGSFAGGAVSSTLTGYSPSSLADACNTRATGGSGKGVKKVTLHGTISIGANQGSHLSNAVMMATDAQQSYCAVVATGAVRCWGANGAGQLGDGTTTTSSVAMPVSGITKAQAIASDGDHSFCALLTTGAVDCWGANGSGELGNGTTTSSSVPVAVTGITTAAAVTSDGSGSYCSVLVSGSVECWGANESGQLGNGMTTASPTPVAVVGITNAAGLASDGDATFCAVLSAGAVDCWGKNTFGQLGDGAPAGSAVPVPASGITNAAGISSDGADSFCATLTTGAVECWGANFAGELGNGTTVKSTVPVAVTGMATAQSVSDDGNESYCAVLASGAVECWGSNNFGQLGNGTTSSSSVPVAAGSITGVTGLSSDGDDSFCALLSSGALNCRGANFNGELGNGTVTASSAPVAVTGIASATAVAGGIHGAADTEHAYCAVVASGAVDCWGSNGFGELGDATTISSSVPVSVIQP